MDYETIKAQIAFLQGQMQLHQATRQNQLPPASMAPQMGQQAPQMGQPAFQMGHLGPQMSQPAPQIDQHALTMGQQFPNGQMNAAQPPPNFVANEQNAAMNRRNGGNGSKNQEGDKQLNKNKTLFT